MRDENLFFVAPDWLAWHPATISRRFRLLLATTTLPPVRLYDLRHGAATLPQWCEHRYKLLERRLADLLGVDLSQPADKDQPMEITL